jgi:TolA-binding protein
MKRKRQIRRAALAGLIAIWSGAALAAPYVILPDGKKMTGTQIRGNADGSLTLTTASGQMSFPKGTKAFVDEPADFARAVKLAKDRQHDEAIKILKEIVKNYRYLEWGQKAQRMLGAAHVGKGDFKAAVQTFQELLAEAPELQKDGEVQAGYMKALEGVGDMEKLGPLLNQAIADGPRNAAAQAQVLRGNMRLKEGDLEGALYDFLRTADFFREAAEVQPEALLRTAECFEKRGDEKTAALYYGKLAKEYPASPLAAQARDKLKAP